MSGISRLARGAAGALAWVRKVYGPGIPARPPRGLPALGRDVPVLRAGSRRASPPLGAALSARCQGHRGRPDGAVPFLPLAGDVPPAVRPCAIGVLVHRGKAEAVRPRPQARCPPSAAPLPRSGTGVGVAPGGPVPRNRTCARWWSGVTWCWSSPAWRASGTFGSTPSCPTCRAGGRCR